MSYKLARHVLVTFTEKSFQFINISLYSIPSISRTKPVTMTLTKKAAVKLSDHTPITYLSSTSLASCNLKNGIQAFCSTHT